MPTYELNYGTFSIFVNAKNRRQATKYERRYGETHADLQFIRLRKGIEKARIRDIRKVI